MKRYAINLEDFARFERSATNIEAGWLFRALEGREGQEMTEHGMLRLFKRDPLNSEATVRLLRLWAPSMRLFVDEGQGWRKL